MKSIQASIFLIVLGIALISGSCTAEEINFNVQDSVTVTVIRAPTSTVYTTPMPSADVETKICTKVYYFIVEHLDTNGNPEYTFAELGTLSQKLIPDISSTIAPETLMGYVENYDALCRNYTNLKIPKPAKIPEINLSQLDATNPSCSPSINVKILWDTINLDTSLPNKGGGIVMGGMSCNSLNFWKWFFKFNRVGEDYSLIGLRFYWIVIALIILVIRWLLSV